MRVRADAYAYAHLSPEGSINADFLTISPFLGRDSMEPFIKIAKRCDKGVFILVRTSNQCAVEIQEAITNEGKTVSRSLAAYINEISLDSVGELGYSAMGAVVAGTYPGEAKELRKIMPNSLLLVPGFGAQGATAKDILSCFNKEGLGALVSSSRGVLYSYLDIPQFEGTKESYLRILNSQVKKTKAEVYHELKMNCKDMKY